jgi:hypothetical protein
MMSKILMIVAVALLIVALVAVGPLLILWSLNTLFPGVGHTLYHFGTWLAAVFLGALLSPTVRVTKK